MLACMLHGAIQLVLCCAGCSARRLWTARAARWRRSSTPPPPQSCTSRHAVSGAGPRPPGQTHGAHAPHAPCTQPACRCMHARDPPPLHITSCCCSEPMAHGAWLMAHRAWPIGSCGSYVAPHVGRYRGGPLGHLRRRHGQARGAGAAGQGVGAAARGGQRCGGEAPPGRGGLRGAVRGCEGR